MAASERGIAAAPGSHDMVQLDSASADLQHAGRAELLWTLLCRHCAAPPGSWDQAVGR